ncbi:MAG: hypothetical protein IGR76_09145 [Synechococcales cyanobacterium T60_A2020_003]|nr:hypothetical protein [Synechococcales cyanobacterium T60_A2020_003]
MLPSAIVAIALGGGSLSEHLSTPLLRSVPSSLVLTSKSTPFTDESNAEPFLLSLRQAETGMNIVTPVILNPIYEFPSFHSELLDQQLQRYAAFMKHSGVPDVLVVGSSRALQGVDPTVLRDALRDQGYDGVTVYNFSVNGATAQVIDVVLRQVLTPDQLPKLIVWADGSRAFNSGRTDATYARITSSPGYQALATGDRPIQFRPELPTGTIASSKEPGTVCVDVPPIPREDLSAQIAVPVKSLCHSWSEANLMAAQTSTNDAIAAPDPLGQLSGAAAAHPIHIDELGFAAIDTRFEPVSYYQQFPHVSGDFDGSYRPFSLEGVQTDATRTIAQFAAEQGIPLVFVSLPLTADYLDPTRQYYEEQFRWYMQQLAVDEGFVFVDLSQAWLYENGYFQDPSHINRYGAAAVANALAIDPTIPWSATR